MTVGGVVIYFTLSGLSYLVVYVLGKRRFHPSYVADRAKNRRIAITILPDELAAADTTAALKTDAPPVPAPRSAAPVEPPVK